MSDTQNMQGAPEKKIIKLTVQLDGVDVVEKVSDGYHTFEELYRHRDTLFIALCNSLSKYNCQYCDAAFGKKENPVWRSAHHEDGTMFPGMYIMGIHTPAGEQITYHLPKSTWHLTGFAEELKKAPAWDGYTSDDVIARLLKLL